MLKVNAVPDVYNVETLYDYLKSFNKIVDKREMKIADALSKKEIGCYESALFQYCYMRQMLGIDSTRLWLIEDVEDDGMVGTTRYHITKTHLFVSYVDKTDMSVVWVEPWLQNHEGMRKYKSYSKMLKNVRARFVSEFKMKGKCVIGEIVAVNKLVDNMREDSILNICNRGLEVMCFMNQWKIRG